MITLETSIIAATIAAAAAIVAGLISVIGNWVQKWIEHNHIRDTMAANLGAEIASIIEITNIRSYVAIGSQYISRLKAGENLNMPRVQDKELKRNDILQTMYPLYNMHIIICT